MFLFNIVCLKFSVMLGAAMPPTKVKKATKVSTKQSLLGFSVKKNVTSPASRKQQQGIFLRMLISLIQYGSPRAEI